MNNRTGKTEAKDWLKVADMEGDTEGKAAIRDVARGALGGWRRKSRLARLSLAGVLGSHVVQGRLKTPDDEEQVRHAERDFVRSS
jgi:hypothetical protein